MYKFFALMFFAFPVLFVGLYTANPGFFFDHIFIYISLIVVVTYVIFVIYVIGQTFLSVREDTVLNKWVTKLVKRSKLVFLSVKHITNAIAFIWTTLLFSVMLALFFWLMSYFAVKFFSMEITGLVRFASGYSTRDTKFEADLRTLNRNVELLMQSNRADKSAQFFTSNHYQYSDDDTQYQYTITYQQDVNVKDDIEPKYRYNLIICSTSEDVKKCTRSALDATLPAAFLLAQNEVVKDFQGEYFPYEELGETLHRIRLVTNIRSMDMMVVVDSNLTKFSLNTSPYALPDRYSESYEYLGEEDNVKTFEYIKNREEEAEVTTSHSFNFNAIDGTISGAFYD